MIEIRTFDGDAEQLVDFIVPIWRGSYEGRMPVPLWSADFLEWNLLLEQNDREARHFLVAAYDGAKMVGFHPARQCGIRLHGQEVIGTLGSWLTVDPEYRRQGVAKKMQQEFERRHQERGAAVNLGFLYLRSSRFLGSRYWLKLPRGTVGVRNMGMWMRPLDHADIARWELHRFERWGTRALALIQSRPPNSSAAAAVRAYRTEDLPECAALVHDLGQSMDLAYLWDLDSLDRQLRYKQVTETLVMEHNGHVAGLVNYCRLDVLCKYPLPLAVIDLVALGTLSKSSRRQLLRAALGHMLDQGIKAAIMIRGCWDNRRDMLATGLMPMFPEYRYIGTTMREDVSLDRIRRVHVLWR